MSDPLLLVLPCQNYALSYLQALNEGMDDKPSPEEETLIINNFQAWCVRKYDLSRPVTWPDGTKVPRVPFSEFWLVKEDLFIGRIQIRHKLNEFLLQFAGNIGYSIRPSEQRKGYGKKILQMTLPHLKALGIDPVLITCNDNNISSIKIIESVNGILENKVPTPGSDIPQRRYWISL